MDLSEIRSELTALHTEASLLLSDAHRTRASIRLVLARRPLVALEERLDGLLQTFVRLDAELIQHAHTPSDINTALRSSAHFAMYTAVRDSVRGLLTDAGAATAALRNQLDFLGSLWLSVIALVVAVIALFK